MLIILEGPDGTGKTTLGEQLSAHYKLAFHPSRGPSKSSEELLKSAEKDANTEGILDRYTLISDWVYKRAARRTPFHHPEVIVRALRDHPAILVFCSTENPIISTKKKAHKSEEQLRECIANATRIKSNYQLIKDYLDINHIPWIPYNWQHDHIEDLLQWINKHASQLPTSSNPSSKRTG